MPKPMFVWSGTAWVSVASEVESLAGFATQSYADNIPGSKLIVPTSVAVGSGSGSVSSNGAVSFTTASSISVNGCFSSTYLHYGMTLTMISTNDTEINFRWRVSGSDNSTSNYSWAQGGTFAASGTFGSGTGNNVAQFRITSSNAANSQKFGTYTLYNPFATDTSGFTGNLAYSSGTANYYGGSIGGGFNGTTSFDGFSIYPTAGTITGSLRIYGIKNG